jgi:hypothetical protein
MAIEPTFPTRIRRTLPVGLLFLLAAGPGWAQPARPVVEARFVDQPPVLDGRLDDPCWQAAPVLTGLTQVLPVEGAPPTERTEARFVFTRDSLYVAVRCHESARDAILVKQMQHDGTLSADDTVGLVFDTFDRRRDGYYFAFNPAGVRVEGLIEDMATLNLLWDTLWEVRTRIDAEGWTAEVAIPFKSLSFDPRSDTWGCNLQRVIRRKQEVVRWTGIARAKHLTQLSDFGALRGLVNLQQGLGLELKPFASVKRRDLATTGQREWNFTLGGDLTYHLTPSLKANATLNTDFAEADVDQRVVNLSRFPLFFPEKRDFFLQDSSLFAFGGLNESVLPYYSRRIGLSAGGQPVDLRAGGRLTGRVGDASVAFLAAQQAGDAGLPAKSLLVGRVAMKVLKESNLGLIGTWGDPRHAGDNALGGVDFGYLNSRLPNGRQLVGHAFAMVTTSDRTGGEGFAFGGDLDFPNEPLAAQVSFRQVSARFDPGLGFVERTGAREYIGWVNYRWRPNTGLLRSVDLGGRPYYTTDLSGRIIAEDHDVPILTFTTPRGGTLTLETTYYRDVVDAPFAMWRGVVVPRGDFGFWQFKPSLQTSAVRPLSVGFRLRHGAFYSGRRTDYRPSLDWRPSRHFTLGAAYELRRIRLPQGDFDVRLASLRLNVAATPDLTWSTVVQYDNKTDEVGLNSRLRWTYRPGCDLFVVVNQGWVDDDGRLHRLSGEISSKVGATIRF